MTTLLPLQPGIRDDRNEVLAGLIERLSTLDLEPTLIYRMASTAPSALPWLLEQFHVSGPEGGWWVDEETERRQLIRDAIPFHRLKGTLAGLQWAARRAGGAVRQAITPPAKTFLSATLTAAERQAFLARYPQLQLFPYRDRGARGQAAFLGVLYPAWRCWPHVTDAIIRLGERGFLFLPRTGALTPLATVTRTVTAQTGTAVKETEIRRNGLSPYGLYPGRLRAPAYLIPQAAANRIYRVQLTTAYAAPVEVRAVQVLAPALSPISLRFEAVAQRGEQHGVHCGGFVAGATVDNRARERIYRRLYLFDPNEPVPPRARRSHLGAVRLGMPAHHAELQISNPGRRFPRQLDRYALGFWAGSDTRRWDLMLAALRAVNRCSDKTLIDAIRPRPRRARRTLTSGPLMLAGQIEI